MRCADQTGALGPVQSLNQTRSIRLEVGMILFLWTNQPNFVARIRHGVLCAKIIETPFPSDRKTSLPARNSFAPSQCPFESKMSSADRQVQRIN